MRIIGGKDYYDHGLGLGYDPEDPVVLVRDKNHNNFLDYDTAKSVGISEITDRNKLCLVPGGWSDVSGLRIDGITFHIRSVSAFFCGKIYQGVSIVFVDDVDEYDHKKPFKVAWSENDFYAILKRRIGDSLKVWENAYYRSYGGFHFSTIDDTDYLKKCIRDRFTVRNASEQVMEFVREHRLSFITVRPAYDQHQTYDKKWYLNHDDLGTIEFYKVFDSYQAFQELSMWVGNMPTPDHKMYQLSDKELITKHGFDKWSFRKAPG